MHAMVADITFVTDHCNRAFINPLHISFRLFRHASLERKQAIATFLTRIWLLSVGLILCVVKFLTWKWIFLVLDLMHYFTSRNKVLLFTSFSNCRTFLLQTARQDYFRIIEVGKEPLRPNPTINLLPPCPYKQVYMFNYIQWSLSYR